MRKDEMLTINNMRRNIAENRVYEELIGDSLTGCGFTRKLHTQAQRVCTQLMIQILNSDATDFLTILKVTDLLEDILEVKEGSILTDEESKLHNARLSKIRTPFNNYSTLINKDSTTKINKEEVTVYDESLTDTTIFNTLFLRTVIRARGDNGKNINFTVFTLTDRAVKILELHNPDIDLDMMRKAGEAILTLSKIKYTEDKLNFKGLFDTISDEDRQSILNHRNLKKITKASSPKKKQPVRRKEIKPVEAVIVEEFITPVRPSRPIQLLNIAEEKNDGTNKGNETYGSEVKKSEEKSEEKEKEIIHNNKEKEGTEGVNINMVVTEVLDMDIFADRKEVEVIEEDITTVEEIVEEMIDMTEILEEVNSFRKENDLSELKMYDLYRNTDIDVRNESVNEEIAGKIFDIHTEDAMNNTFEADHFHCIIHPERTVNTPTEITEETTFDDLFKDIDLSVEVKTVKKEVIEEVKDETATDLELAVSHGSEENKPFDFGKLMAKFNVTHEDLDKADSTLESVTDSMDLPKDERQEAQRVFDQPERNYVDYDELQEDNNTPIVTPTRFKPRGYVQPTVNNVQPIVTTTRQPVSNRPTRPSRPNMRPDSSQVTVNRPTRPIR